MLASKVVLWYIDMVFGTSEAVERLTQVAFWQNVAIYPFGRSINMLSCKSAVFEAQRTGLNWGRRGIGDLIFFITLRSLKKSNRTCRK